MEPQNTLTDLGAFGTETEKGDQQRNGETYGDSYYPMFYMDFFQHDVIPSLVVFAVATNESMSPLFSF